MHQASPSPAHSNYSQPVSSVSHPLAGESAFVRKVGRLIRAQLGDEHFDVTALARQVRLSVSQLNRRLNARIDQSAGQLIWAMRMEHAATLLLREDYSIARVGTEVGYTYQAHFCRSFKRCYRCTPSQYRATYR